MEPLAFNRLFLFGDKDPLRANRNIVSRHELSAW